MRRREKKREQLNGSTAPGHYHKTLDAAHDTVYKSKNISCTMKGGENYGRRVITAVD